MPSLFPETDSATDSAASDTWVNAHCDGGARGNPGPAGYGAVLVDDQGLTLAELSEFLGVRSNNVAEYAGLLGVLEWTLAHGYRRLRVTSDSLLMVKQMKGQYKVASPDLKPMWEEARRRVGQLAKFEITHALRHKNKVADRLANEAMDRGMNRGRAATGNPTQPVIVRATPYPTRAATPPEPPRETPHEAPGLFAQPTRSPAPEAPVRGIIREGVVRLLNGATLPEGAHVRIIPE